MKTILKEESEGNLISLVNYELLQNENSSSILVNPLIGKKISLNFLGTIHCVHCSNKTPKSYGNGYCYKCFFKLPECDSCILKPELCHYHHGTCRDSNWGEENCLIPHIVYLSYTSGLKVGITKERNLKTRWVDQGAIKAIPLFRIAERLEAGRLEVMLKEKFNDKTNFSKMLLTSKYEEEETLEEIREKILSDFEYKLEEFITEFGEDHLEIIEDISSTSINYPISELPKKISRFDIKKSSLLEGQLLGIKGQYLILDTAVINIRNFSGYDVSLEF